VLDRDHPYIFIDACMQMWPDADFARAHRHGVTAYAVTAWDPLATVDQALEGLMFWHLIARQHAGLVVVRSAADIRRLKNEGRSGLLLAAQDGDWIGTQLHRVEAFARLGLRMMLPAYNRANQICAGCLDRTDGGLTRFGQLVIDECARVGILLDCSHLGKRSSLDVIERSPHPCVFSHSNPAALVPNPRNIDDQQIKACAARGGVVCLCTWGPLVMRPGSKTRPTLDDYITLVDHVVALVGIDHAGVSTDMSLGTYPDHVADPWGMPALPAVSADYDRVVTSDIRSPLRNIDGFSDYAEVAVFAERLAARGYSRDAIGKLLGGNLLRAFEQVWRSSPGS
jgi:membrane dipeptidase